MPPTPTPKSKQDVQVLCITLSDRKAYLGMVLVSPNLRHDSKYIEILPFRSGYRDKDTLELNLNLRYPMERYGVDLDPAQFLVVIPLAEIRTARVYEEAHLPLFAAPEVSRDTTEADGAGC